MPTLTPRILLLVQLGTTLPMAGLIWFVQLVHYPLFASVGSSGFALYEAEHARRTTWVVAPLMLAELLSSLLLLLQPCRAASVSSLQAWCGAVLVAILWLSTALLQVPMHNRLGHGWDPLAAHWLVTTNWIRTVAWTARAALVLWWVR